MKRRSELRLRYEPGVTFDVESDQFSPLRLGIASRGNYRAYQLRVEEARDLADALLFASGSYKAAAE